MTREIKQRQKIDNDVISGNSVVIIIFPIYGQFGAIEKLDSGRIVCKTSLTVAFYLTKTETRTKKSLTQLWHYCFNVKVLFFFQKVLIFCTQKMLKSAKLIGSWYVKGLFSEISSIILTSFRPPPLTSKRNPKKPTQIRVK